MHKIFVVSLALVVSVSSMAQKTKDEKKAERKERINALIKQEEEGVIAYHKHTVFGFKLTNDGYGGFFEIGRGQSIRRSLLFQLDIAERKHSKEQKQSLVNIAGSPFIFGKQNFFYPVKLGVQQQYLLGNKSNKNGVSVTGNFGGGVSMGLLRPYLLQVVKNGEIIDVGYETYDSLTKDLGNVVGGPNLGKGWGKMKVTPGAYAKAALRFDYGRYNEVVSAIEVGITGEYYSKKINQILGVEPKAFFFNAYFSLVFGKRK